MNGTLIVVAIESVTQEEIEEFIRLSTGLSPLRSNGQDTPEEGPEPADQTAFSA